LRITALDRRGGVETSPSEHDGPSDHHELLAIVDGLPFRQRAVLVARYWLDMSEADIADLLDCRPGTVKSLASRAMATLRKELP
jgi:RNA polymerase sigma factor (sigma-70 family)